MQPGHPDIDLLNSLLISPEITQRAIDILSEYHLSHGLAIPDALIAATSLDTGFSLFTYNTRNFKFIKGLHLYKF